MDGVLPGTRIRLKNGDLASVNWHREGRVGFTLTSGIGKGFSDVRDETEVEELPTTFEDLSQKSDDELREMLITLRKERREVPVAKAKATRQKAASTAKAKDTGGLPKVDLSKLSDEDKAALRAALMGILKEGLG